MITKLLESSFCVDQKKMVFSGERRISNFLPVVTGAYWAVDKEGFGPPSAVELKIIREGIQPECVCIPYNKLDNFNFEARFLGCSCTDEKCKSTKKEVVRFIRERINQLPSEKRGISFSQTGWHGNQFITGDRVIGNKEGVLIRAIGEKVFSIRRR